MGCGGSAEKSNLEIHIALVGSGGSGKTTLVKQWRIIHGEYDLVADLTNIKSVLAYNIFQGLSDLVEFLEEKEIKKKS